jgi:hypothetical protein
MANVVLAVGSSHGPSIQTDPATWPRLGEKDTRDPRFDFDALLKAAKPGLAVEITPEVQRALSEQIGLRPARSELTLAG